MARHPHADVIHAWAEGEVIQFQSAAVWYDWHCVGAPSFYDNCKYRIKPKEEDTWTPCKSGKLRFVIRKVEKAFIPTSAMLSNFQQTYTTSILQQLMVNQKAEYKWMDVPIEEEDNG